MEPRNLKPMLRVLDTQVLGTRVLDTQVLGTQSIANSVCPFSIINNKSEMPYECIRCNIEKDHTLPLKRLRKVDLVADQRIFELYSLLSKHI